MIAQAMEEEESPESSSICMNEGSSGFEYRKKFNDQQQEDKNNAKQQATDNKSAAITANSRRTNAINIIDQSLDHSSTILIKSNKSADINQKECSALLSPRPTPQHNIGGASLRIVSPMKTPRPIFLNTYYNQRRSLSSTKLETSDQDDADDDNENIQCSCFISSVGTSDSQSRLYVSRGSGVGLITSPSEVKQTARIILPAQNYYDDELSSTETIAKKDKSNNSGVVKPIRPNLLCVNQQLIPRTFSASALQTGRNCGCNANSDNDNNRITKQTTLTKASSTKGSGDDKKVNNLISASGVGAQSERQQRNNAFGHQQHQHPQRFSFWESLAVHSNIGNHYENQYCSVAALNQLHHHSGYNNNSCNQSNISNHYRHQKHSKNLLSSHNNLATANINCSSSSTCIKFQQNACSSLLLSGGEASPAAGAPSIEQQQQQQQSYQNQKSTFQATQKLHHLCVNQNSATIRKR